MLRWSSHRGQRKVRSIRVRALTFTLICASLGHFTTGKPGWDMRARSITMRALTLTPAFSGGPYLQKIPLSVIQIYPQKFACFIKLWSNCFKLPCWPTRCITNACFCIICCITNACPSGSSVDSPIVNSSGCTRIYTITWLLCAFSLVVDRDLLKDTHIYSVKSTSNTSADLFFFFNDQKSFNKSLDFYCIKQIDYIIPCVCIVIDHRRRHSV